VAHVLNASDEPCRILEIIALAGSEGFSSELVDLGGVTGADPAVLGSLCERYALEMDPSSVPGLIPSVTSEDTTGSGISCLSIPVLAELSSMIDRQAQATIWKTTSHSRS
jgi:hypothetical protein